MIKCEVVKEFTLGRFDELKNIERRGVDTKGKLYVGDTFECGKEMVDYLTGKNLKGEVVIKVVEVKPEIDKTNAKEIEEAPKEDELTKEEIKTYKSKKTTKKKTSKK